MFIPKFIRRRIEHFVERTVVKVQNAKDLVFRGGIVALICIIIVWAAIFMYSAFYYAYMPSIAHIRPVYLQFKSCDASPGICSFPSAHVQLTKRQQILMVGQSYKMYLNLDMPESPANRGVGMFMVCVNLHDKDSTLVGNSCRSTMLHYRSYLIHTLSTLFFSPFLIFGSSEEKQNINLELFHDFEDDQNHPVTDIYVEIQSRHIELYSAVLHIHAHFTGLRYLMFHWPVLSAIVGISSNLFFIVLVCLLSWLRLYQMNEGDEDTSSYVYEKLDGAEKNKIFVFKGENDEDSLDDASFMEDLKTDGSDGSTELLNRDSITELAAFKDTTFKRRTSSSDC